MVDTYTRAENLRFEIASALYPPHEITGLAMGSEQLTTDSSIRLRHCFYCYLYYGTFLQRVATYSPNILLPAYFVSFINLTSEMKVGCNYC